MNIEQIQTKRFDAKNVGPSGVLDYYLFSPIGNNADGPGIMAQGFANDFAFINDFLSGEVKQINVRINSPGGSIVEGLGILAAIRNSKIPVDTYVDGLAASMAFVVAMAGKKRFANDFSRAMIHDPNMDSENLTDADRAVLLEFKNMLIHIFKNNSSLSETEIDSIMTAETWYNSEQLLAVGLIDSIVKTERNLGLFSNSSKTIYNFANELVVEQQKNKNIFSMKKIFAKLSELKRVTNVTETDTDKIETAVVETIDELTSTNETLQKDNDTLKGDNDTLKAENDKLKAEPDSAVVTEVENAIKAGKIDPAKRAEMLVVAKNNLELFKTIVSTVPNVAKKAINKITFGGVDVNVDNNGKVNGVGLRELEKTNPKLVKEILNNDPETYKKMYVAQYGVAPKQ